MGAMETLILLGVNGTPSARMCLPDPLKWAPALANQKGRSPAPQATIAHLKRFHLAPTE
ncbi:hypothetical protein CBM2592_P340009 [Cupriavidus taiwanensis]|uniref:Uncharacterized protein n=1 Tax=Cupriavidus taiwanensis TaxID=164546 RepID=A0A375F9R5_9BURK|nr:hypothetical protein CBM2592_P340009 [Cupriavidus taiwanensis]SOY75881.1 hypothetical protein CBM2588_P350006 [Cupriavidus taiwanensis]SOY77928.1 hypothetical protein CBM2586_P320008 [Cupriavidus taiwanensis]SOZ06985.1 hypothetical protein CBM2599_P310007 [Cupriavidus taiwanensis]SOZ95724.1 hypothetical protein CBM2598_P250007 [Cupriavidus taiwanensis]